jgi:hypothetical protein
MKKIFTFLAVAFLTISGSAQVVSINIDTIWYTPSNPVVGDSIFLHLSGTANCAVTQEGPTFISDTGRLHTVSICYMGEHNTPPSTFNFSYNVYTAQSPGQDTLEWMFFYNKYDTLLCDTVLNFGMFIIQIDPVAVFSQQSSSLAVSWNAYTSSLTYDKLYTKADFQLMDMSGRIIQRQQLYATNAEIKIPNVQEGIYMVYISDEEGILYRHKIFIGNEMGGIR